VVEAAVSRNRRRIVLVWLVLVALLVTIAAAEYAERRRSAAATGSDARRLLAAPVNELGAVEIAEAGRLHRFERDASGRWFYHGVHSGTEGEHAHAADPAAAERVDRTLAALGRARVERELPLEGDGAVYGLTAPDVVVLVYRPGQRQPLAQYAVGQVAPDTLSRYVLRVGTRSVVTIPEYHVESLRALLRDVGAPPAASGR
jgi:hypothetical protein